MTTEKEVYEKEILPLLKQVREICERANLASMACFMVDNAKGEAALFHVPYRDASSPFGDVIMRILGVTDPRQLPPDIATVISRKEDIN